MQDARVFFRLTKVDEERRLIYGRATQEVVDRSDEIFDYDTSRPLFEKWSAEVHKDSGGKSLGNIREMHGNIAAGRVEDIDFDDDEKAIDITAKVVDDGSWDKVLQGVLTGFSVGGRYEKKWEDTVDGKKVTRFTASPTEISLVDRPCVPTARFFDIQKRDGSVEQVAFKNWASPASATSGAAGYEEEGSKKVAAREDVSPKAGDDKYGDVEFADEKNKKYPIDTEEHIRAAWNYFHHPKSRAKYSTKDANTIRSKIVAAWKKKIDAKGPPAANKLAKGVEGVAALADLSARLKWLADGQAFERDQEGDNSDMPEKLKGAAKDLLDLLAEMAEEEGAELLEDAGAGDDNPEAEPVLTAADAAEMRKSLAQALDTVKRTPNKTARASLYRVITDAVSKLDPAAQPKEGNMVRKAGMPNAGGSVGEPEGSESEDSDLDTRKTDEAEDGDEDATPKSKKARKGKKSPPPKDEDDDEDEGEDGDEDEDEDDEEEPPKKKSAKSRKSRKFDTDDEDEDRETRRVAKTVIGVLSALGVVSPSEKTVRKSADSQDTTQLVGVRKGAPPARFDVQGMVARTQELGNGGDGQLAKFQEAQGLMKSVPAPFVITAPEPDKDKDQTAHTQWLEKRQQATFAHFVKALHQRGPDETWDPRQFGGQFQTYRNHA